MADINIERREGTGWLWWVLGLIVLALIVWAIASTGEDEQVVMEPAATEVVPIAPAPESEVTTPTRLSIAEVRANPAAYQAAPFSGEFRVAEVPTNRGFWIEENGQRLFAIILDQPAEEPKDINPDQTVRITEGTLRDASFLPQLAGEPLDAQTQRIVEGEPIFLVADESRINILTAGTPQPGTDEAETAGTASGR